jgi:hypothetical protein
MDPVRNLDMSFPKALKEEEPVNVFVMLGSEKQLECFNFILE